jgi:hypothetical protein
MSCNNFIIPRVFRPRVLPLKQGKSKTLPTLTKEIIEAAIAGFEGQKQKIDAQIAELRAMLAGRSRSRS